MTDDQASPPKRRARTGCLTCRARKRKCDEGKPVCQSCLERRLTCRYPSKIKFTPGWVARSAGSTGVQPSGVASRASAVRQTDAAGSEGTFAAGLQVVSPDASDSCPPSTSQRMSVTDQTLPRDVPETRVAGRIATDATAQSSPSSASAPPLQSQNLNVRQRDRGPNDFQIRNHSMQNDPDHILKLLIAFRYEISPMLDASGTEQTWGIDILSRGTKSDGVQDAMQSLTNQYLYRMPADPNLPDVITPDSVAHDAISRDDRISVEVLEQLDMILRTPPSQWLRKLIERRCWNYLPANSDKRRQVWDRISMAAILAAPRELLGGIAGAEIAAFAQPISPQAEPDDHLQRALILLRRSLRFYHPRLNTASHTSPLLSSWLSCWSDVQIWYADRPEHFLAVVELDEESCPVEIVFAPIVFSSTAAILANIVHHLTSLLLLQHRPRSAVPVAEALSSISVPWHALRIARIASIAVDDGTWDPLLVGAIVKAGEELSHTRQLSALLQVLKATQDLCGMQLHDTIHAIEQTEVLDAVTGF